MASAVRETSSERLRGISSFDNGKTKVFSAVCCQGTNKAKKIYMFHMSWFIANITFVID